MCFFLIPFSFTESLCESSVYVSISINAWIFLCGTKLTSVPCYTSFMIVLFTLKLCLFMIHTSSWEGDEKFSSSGSCIPCGIANPEIVTASSFLDRSCHEFCDLLPNSSQESIELLDVIVGLPQDSYSQDGVLIDSRDGYSPTSVLDRIRSFLGLPFELDALLSEWRIVIDLRQLPTLVTDDSDATVNAGDGGIAGTVVFASLQRLEVWFNLFLWYFSNELYWH